MFFVFCTGQLTGLWFHGVQTGSRIQGLVEDADSHMATPTSHLQIMGSYGFLLYSSNLCLIWDCSPHSGANMERGTNGDGVGNGESWAAVVGNGRVAEKIIWRSFLLLLNKLYFCQLGCLDGMCRMC